jgi:hypothetical protein
MVQWEEPQEEEYDPRQVQNKGTGRHTKPTASFYGKEALEQPTLLAFKLSLLHFLRE